MMNRQLCPSDSEQLHNSTLHKHSLTDIQIYQIVFIALVLKSQYQLISLLQTHGSQCCCPEQAPALEDD